MCTAHSWTNGDRWPREVKAILSKQLYRHFAVRAKCNNAFCHAQNVYSRTDGVQTQKALH